MLHIEIILLALCLSMDAFSLALSVGMNNIKKNKNLIYSFFVGLFHFIMPILGFKMRALIDKIMYIPNKIVFSFAIIFIIIEVLLDKDEKKININPLLFAFSVSIDSFSIGLSIQKNIIISSTIFSVISFLITYLGFILGNEIGRKIESNKKVISISILLIILIYNLL